MSVCCAAVKIERFNFSKVVFYVLEMSAEQFWQTQRSIQPLIGSAISKILLVRMEEDL